MLAPFQISPSFHVLRVSVLSVGNRFKWTVREDGGKVVESASESYATKTAAFRAGNAAARAFRKCIADKHPPATPASVKSRLNNGGPSAPVSEATPRSF